MILAFNRRGPLRKTLTIVRDELSFPSDRLEIMVVDNASTDGTQEMVREEFPEVTVLRSPANVGASAWNLGFGRAKGDYVLILDDDCYMAGDDLIRAASAARACAADLVSFRIASSELDGYFFNDEFSTGLLSFWGCAAMFSKSALDELGGYDPAIFIWANELELTMRFLNAGKTHLYLPEVTPVHMKGPWDGAYNIRAHVVNSRNHAYVAAKSLTPGDLARVLVNMAAHSVAEALRGHPEALRGLPKLLEGGWVGLHRRRAVAPRVSKLYRRNWPAFRSPFLGSRSPLERWRTNSDPRRREASRLAAGRRFFRARPELYPEQRAVLRLEGAQRCN